MNKTFKTLLFALSFTVISAQATQIWLQNNFQKAIIVKFNRMEITVEHGKRISLGSFFDLESLSIRTNTFGSFYSNIFRLKEAIGNHKDFKWRDAVIAIEPSTISWDVRLLWETPAKKNY